jgi:transcription elongation GreA/GreB family factor
MLAGVNDARRAIKKAFVAALVARLDAERATMKRAADDARHAATHEEAKPENDKDTRALEASYLAGAQAARVRAIEVEIKALEGLSLLDLDGKTVQASAVVTVVDEDDAATTFFLAPAGGGTPVEAAGRSAQVLTPQAPLGQALLGKSAGESIEMRVRGKLRELTITELW